MITAIYDLRDYGFKHTDTTSLAVTFRKMKGSVKWEVVELSEYYIVFKNGLLKERLYDLEELYNWLTENKII